MSGQLIVVPTPVGNMADMTPRAIEALRSCDLILAEDTRTSAPLLKHFGIENRLASFHKFNEHEMLARTADQIESGQTVCLISDAGTPGISDPGFLLSRECRLRGLPVVTLPGPTAFVPALVDSGLPCDRFSFEGFLPVKKGRQSTIARIAADDRTTVIYESPLRLPRTLAELATACGPDRPASVSREISKLHEQTVRGTLAELVDHFTQNQPRGEIVIVLGAAVKEGVKPHRNKFKDATDDNQL